MMTTFAQAISSSRSSSAALLQIKFTSLSVLFHNRVLSTLTAERLQIIYANDGIQGVREQLKLLRRTGHI
jgi:hypothetical protein